MTDQEIIATWMEPKPRRSGRSRDSIGGWWRYCGDPVEWQIPPMWKGNSLGALHKVEARLTDALWQHYAVIMFARCCTEASTSNLIEDLLTKNRRALLHASAEQKIVALTTVLRPIVEAA